MTTDGRILDALYQTLLSRKDADPDTSYTARLFAKGISKCAQKVGEEGVEVALAAVEDKRDELISESADLLYHLLVVLAARDIAPGEVFAALKERQGVSGLEVKASRKKTS